MFPLTEEQLAEAGVPSGLVRFAVGLEAETDLIADLDHALGASEPAVEISWDRREVTAGTPDGGSYIELVIFHAVDEGPPFAGSEDESRPLGVLAVTDSHNPR
jgi:hypothetical protein